VVAALLQPVHVQLQWISSMPFTRNMNEAIVLLLPGIVLGVELSSASRLAAFHNINK
jgi:hypothetical protein